MWRKISVTYAEDGRYDGGEGAGRRDNIRCGIMSTNLAALSAPTFVYVFLVERVRRSVVFEMAGKELQSSFIEGVGHDAEKSGVMEVSGESGRSMY